MADEQPLLAPGFDEQNLSVKRRRALAKLLMESEMPQGQMVSGHYVAPSALGGLNAVARQLLGAYGERKADEQEAGNISMQQKALVELLRGNEGKSPEEVYDMGASDPRLGMELNNQFLTQGFSSRIAQQKAQAEAAQDAAKAAAQEKRDEFKAFQQQQRDEAKFEQMTKIQQANFAQQQQMQMAAFENQSALLDRRLAASDGRGSMKPPAGYRFTPEGNLEAIPGGPASTKQEIAAEKAQTAAVLAGSKADTVINMIDKGLEQTSADTTGLKGSVLGQLPGTKSYDLRNTIDTVKANIGFKELSDMRAASPTGGALGQVAVKELDFLQSSIASLNQGQSEKQLKENLNKVKTHYHNWKNVMQRAAASPQGGSPTASSEQGVVNWDDLP